MPVQDLTPQLRTRLSRVERAVGWFVIVATVLLFAGFAYYVYHTAQRKGWFLTKLRYHTYVQSAAGLQVGDPIILMGFPVGQITEVTAMPPFSAWGNVYVEFIIREPFYGYIWTDSYVRVVTSGILGGRTMEVVQGGTTTNTNLFASYNIDEDGNVLGVWDHKASNHVAYTPKSKGYGFEPALETPPVTDRLEGIANQAEQALPGILDLTNHVARVLENLTDVTANAGRILVQAQPIVTNLTLISSFLTNGAGSLGDWAIPTNLNLQLEQTLASANSTLVTANTNVAAVASNLNLSLENVANITSNLNEQVQRNDQILGQISAVVTNADSFVQGLKGHWLLRSAFREERRAQPPPATAPPTRVTPDPSAPPGELPAERPSPRPPAQPKTGQRIPPG